MAVLSIFINSVNYRGVNKAQEKSTKQTFSIVLLQRLTDFYTSSLVGDDDEEDEDEDEDEEKY